MYRIMIVDDEPLILAGITSMLDWEAHGCKIVGKAANGQAALKSMEELQPDIVITDIKMPAMDGISLMKEAKSAGYPSVFILLTNLEEFTLAKEALHLGAVDYLVKLELNEEALLAALVRACEKCEKIRQEENGAWGQTDRTLPEQIRDYFKSILIYDTLAETEPKLEETIRKKFRRPVLLLINFNFGYAGFSDSFTREDQKKTMGFAENIISEMLGGFFRENCLLRRDQNGFAVVFSTAGIADYEEEVRTMGRKLQSVMRDYFEVSVTIAVSSRGTGLEELQELLYQAMSAMNYSYYEGSGAIVFYSQKCEENSSRSENFNIHFLKKDLTQRIRQNDSEGFAELMNQIIGLFLDYKPSKTQAVNACNNLYYFISSQFEEREDDSFPYAVDIVGQLNRMEDLNTIIKWLTDFGASVTRVLEEYKGHKIDRNVELAIQYVEAHYKEKISLNQVAAELNVSLGHLSSSFKRQTGKNFSDYTTEIKIEKAKELIESRAYMVYEIADMLGFDTPFYFSRVFKKVTGISPREYEMMCNTKEKNP